MAKGLACILVVGTAREMPAQRSEPPARRYSNPGFEYVVQLPRDLSIERSTPPTPDHGFRARVAQVASVWVSADRETENVGSLSAEVENVRAAWREDGCTETERKAATLGGVPASELTFRCGPTARGGPPTTLRLLLTLRAPADHGSITYQVGVRYPQDGRTRADAERVFRALVDGFSFTRR
jgi:hypothetical protein